MSMRRVMHKDKQGRKTWVNIPENAPDSHAAMGLLVGPPSLVDLKLPRDVEVFLHNQLFDRGLIERKDVKARPQDIFAALQAAYRVDVAAITNLYE